MSRYFVVRNKHLDDAGECLVEAHTVSAALRRVATHYCDAWPAKADEIVAMMRRGCDVIEIAPWEQGELPLDPPDPKMTTAPAADAPAIPDGEIL